MARPELESAVLHLIVGPVGSGKSTFARTLEARHGAVRLVLDDWMARLYGDDPRPDVDRMGWYVERTRRCLDLIEALALRLHAVGTPVVLEVGLIRRQERAAFYDRVDAAGAALAVYLVDAPRDVRRERVARRNEDRGETFHVPVPPAIFELASDLWEPPDPDEIADRGVIVVP